MKPVINKARLSLGFSRAAARYDRHAEPQRRMAARLDEILPDIAGDSILEVGCGTGIFTAMLRKKYPAARIMALDLAPGMIARCRAHWPDGRMADFQVGDAEKITSSANWALIAANSVVQWLDNRLDAFANLRRALMPGGALCFSAPLEGTLHELACCHELVLGEKLPAPALWNEKKYAAALRSAGWRARLMQVEAFVLHYPRARDVLAGLKGVGASAPAAMGAQPLTSGQLRRLMTAYEREFRAAAGVRATYRALYCLAEGV